LDSDVPRQLGGAVRLRLIQGEIPQQYGDPVAVSRGPRFHQAAGAVAVVRDGQFDRAEAAEHPELFRWDD